MYFMTSMFHCSNEKEIKEKQKRKNLCLNIVHIHPFSSKIEGKEKTFNEKIMIIG